jgi:hypothetical protein
LLFCCSYVWLNEYSSQFLPILGLLALRVVVGAGEALHSLIFLRSGWHAMLSEAQVLLLQLSPRCL